MSKFEIKGKYKGGLVGKTWLPFSKVVESQNEKNAANKVYLPHGKRTRPEEGPHQDRRGVGC